ncbi:hypothetical protein OVA07_10130 [Novosphingobium sp. SL115]|uniref:SRPBCC family protein n=1 Tax=Novosphingobium sp. SL115 TaxID=2995150 RepID=UPI0022738CC9|nr:SRPBCC family protein [Novosphingobium sp. SL115]MCY1671365.1 hypothetical protein [Novosphingobium sp. SL115]
MQHDESRASSSETLRQNEGAGSLQHRTGAACGTPGEIIYKTVTTVYNMFPNCVIITSPWYVSVMLLHPRAPNHTTVEYHMLTRTVPDNPKAEELYARSYDMILNVFGNEDFRAAEISHAGLATGALKTCVYSGLEASIATYYGVLDSFLPR